MKSRRPKLDTQGLIGKAEANRYRARIASAGSSVGALGRFMLRRDQKSGLKIIDEDVLPENLLDDCVVSYPADCEVVTELDKQGGEAKLKEIAQTLSAKGYPAMMLRTSVVPDHLRCCYPDRAPVRWTMRAIMPSKWEHHVWSEYIGEQLGKGVLRSCRFDATGKKVKYAQPMRLPGFTPQLQRVKAPGWAKDLRRDGTVDSGSIKRATDRLYRRPGVLKRIAEYCELIPLTMYDWYEAGRREWEQSQKPKPITSLYVIKRERSVYKPRDTVCGQEEVQAPLNGAVDSEALDQGYEGLGGSTQSVIEPPRGPVEQPTLRKVVPKPLSEERRRRLTVDVDDDTMRLLVTRPRLGDRSQHALHIVRRLKARGWSENSIAELISLYDGLVAYQHTGGKEDGNAEHGRARLAEAYQAVVVREGDQKRIKDAVYEEAKLLPLPRSARAVLDVMLDVPGLIAHPGDPRIQQLTGLSPRGVTKGKYKLMECGLMQETGPKRGPGDTQAQSYMLKEPTKRTERSTGGCETEVHTSPKPLGFKASRYEVHQQLRALRGRGVASAFRWRGDVVIDLVMQGMTAEEVCVKLGVEGLTEAWQQRSATHRRIKAQRAAYKDWLRRSFVDDGEAFLAWDREMTRKLREAGCGQRWKAAA